MNTEVWLRSRIETIVRGGHEIRQNVAAAVAAAAHCAGTAADGFGEVVRATMAGANNAVDAALPATRARTMRLVIEGLGDGLALAAHAAELTLHELGSDMAKFARDDLHKLAGAFRDIAGQFVEGVVAAATSARGHASGEIQTLRDHATATLQRIKPLLAATVDAASRDPAGLAKDSLIATVAGARGATGGLLRAVGRQLEAMGIALAPSPRSMG